MKEHFKKTWKNKVASVLLLLLGIFALILDRDITVLTICSVIAIPLFICTEDMLYRIGGNDEDDD
jgi:hypothetical protein